ncbi:DNA modification methylase [Microbacterium sp.]|uniref:DNA modification methylase n=1 Tax=Microbacterium sp. TaxID=51671 RepID=UPI002811D298|nr:DNA modification methylase [Microbacterium sp.]
MNSRLAASASRRLVAVAALGVAVALGTTGCTFITHQATTNEYPASDGVNIDSTGGPVVVRNAFVIASSDGSTGNLVGALVNEGTESATLTIDVEGQQLRVRVPAGESVSLGGDEEPLQIDALDVQPGATVEMLFTSADGEAEPAQVPVLDGALPYYRDLVPGGFTPVPQPSEEETTESSH